MAGLERGDWRVTCLCLFTTHAVVALATCGVCTQVAFEHSPKMHRPRPDELVVTYLQERRGLLWTEFVPVYAARVELQRAVDGGDTARAAGIRKGLEEEAHATALRRKLVREPPPSDDVKSKHLLDFF